MLAHPEVEVIGLATHAGATLKGCGESLEPSTVLTADTEWHIADDKSDDTLQRVLGLRGQADQCDCMNTWQLKGCPGISHCECDAPPALLSSSA